MKNIDKFQPQVEAPQKMTKARLYSTLEELNIRYMIDGEGSNFKIIIDLPEEHIKEKNELLKTAVLNDTYQTNFDKEKLMPLVREIKRSTNFDCNIENTGSQYIISVVKK